MGELELYEDKAGTSMKPLVAPVRSTRNHLLTGVRDHSVNLEEQAMASETYVSDGHPYKITVNPARPTARNTP